MDKCIEKDNKCKQKKDKKMDKRMDGRSKQRHYLYTETHKSTKSTKRKKIDQKEEKTKG